MKSPRWVRWIGPEVLVLAALALYPLADNLLGIDGRLSGYLGKPLGSELANMFIFAVLALGLNVVVGYTGLLNLGIAAFFGIGAYTAAILTIAGNPFQIGFVPSLIAATLVAGLAGLMLGAPTLRLRGDYLAIVTLGFGEVVRFSIRNLESITGGTATLGPIPPPVADWGLGYKGFYLLCLGILIAVVVLLRNLENSRLGRAWMAIREDELAATCMGVNAARAKMTAFAVAAALAGMAGCLYATKLSNTADPDGAYGFSRSIIVLCCIILGGLGSIRGALLGVFLLIGFENILSPFLDSKLQEYNFNPNNNRLLTFSNWKFMIFGLALILMMRFRPEGLLPSQRVKRELHTEGA